MLTERKVQGHEHFHRHRLPIQQRWLIPPLLERLNRRLDQQRASRHHFHLRHSPLGVDHAVNKLRLLELSPASQEADIPAQLAGSSAAPALCLPRGRALGERRERAEAVPAGDRFLPGCRRARRPLPARDSSDHATCDPARGGRRSLLLYLGDLFGNELRSKQLAFREK